MDVVEEIKGRLNIEDVLGEYVQLKRAGRNFKGLSPFNNEKTPSFIVSPEKQIWHDFSSGKGGNMFSFVMEVEGVDFKGALDILGRKAGIDMEQARGFKGPSSKLKTRLLEANKLAAKFYQVQFKNNRSALEYVFKTRQFNKQTALDFQIGYAPNKADALSNFMLKKGFTKTELSQAGLISRGRGVDMFRHRLVIPLMDGQGQIIGFTARLLSQTDNNGDMPKYINTPQTVLYDKSRHVFGLHLAKDSIRKQKFSVLVEGNLDVVSSHQAGVKNVVATAGTALTEQHFKTLGRFAKDVRLCFDSDQAGLQATERAIPIANKTDIALSIINLKNHKDPDELIKSRPEAWQKAVNNPAYAVDWLIEHFAGGLDLSSGQGKRAFSDALLPMLKNLSDAVEKDHYLTLIAGHMQVSPAALRDKLQSSSSPTRLKKKSAVSQQASQTQLEWAKAQDHLLAIVMMRPELRDLLDILDTDMLPQESAQELLNYLQSHPDFDGDITKVASLQNFRDYVKILTLQYEALFAGLDEVEARYEAARLRARLIEIFVKTKKIQVTAALNEANDDETRKILTRVKTLDNLLKVSRKV